MPELPEVEVIRRTVWPYIADRRIQDVRVLEQRLPQNLSPGELEERLRGRTVTALRRRGKYLLASLDNGEGFALHLRMTGQLLVLPRQGLPGAQEGVHPETVHPYTRLVLVFSDCRVELRDQRRFATLYWAKAEDLESAPFLRRLGPEPLGPFFSPDGLVASLKGRTAPIKAALLDQSSVAGLGNIYADEVLFRARIHPRRPAGSLERDEALRLYEAIREVLEEALAQGGTTIRDYRNGAGERGYFQLRLRVYGREGQPCPSCGHPVRRETVGGRGTWFCEECQPFAG